MILIADNKSEYQLGGEFGLTVDDFRKAEKGINIHHPRKKNCSYLDTGRSAIYIALLSIIEQGGKREAWLPRYCCKSVFLPFKKLGFKLNFYSLGSDLKSPCDLPTRLGGETFFFIHYFGKSNRAMLDYLEKMKQKQEFFVIEDCVQALLSSQIGMHDYVVYSYRKFFPQPDGALLASDYPIDSHPLAPADEAFVSRKLIGKLIRGESDVEDEQFMNLFAQAEELIDNHVCPREMSCLSQHLLLRTDFEAIASKRRANFFYLVDAFKQLALDDKLIHPLFDSLENHEVPLGMPIVVDAIYRDKLRSFLSSQQIYCPIHWPLTGEECLTWETELILSSSLLTLPIDQRIDRSALTYLIDKIAAFFRRVTENRPLTQPDIRD